jgi:2-hydroxy-3-oxopropionate reductase
MSKLGFIGLGTMGAPMAGHLLAGSHSLFVNTRSKVPGTLTSGGAVVCPSAQAVAQQADIIFLMVPDTPDVERVLFGANGVSEGLTAGKVVVDMSSISPIETKAFASRINQMGCEYLDGR